MEAKKLISFLLLAALLGFAAYLFMVDTSSTLKGEETNFELKDPKEVGKIFIAEKNGKRNTFTRTPEGWVLNKTMKANDGKVEGLLLKTMQNMRVRQPVPEGAFKTVVNELASIGIKIELYDTLGQKMKSFYIGNATEDLYGTYAIMEGADTPYILHIPGFNGYLTPRFRIKQDAWRDLLLARCSPSSLDSVQVSYTDSGRVGFTVLSTDTGFAVRTKAEVEVDSARLYNYLKIYGKYTAATFIDEGKEAMMDSLAREPKVATLEIWDKQPKNNLAIDFYEVPDTNVSHLYGVVERRETGEKLMSVIRYYHVRRSLVNPYFFEKRKEKEWYYM